MDEYPSFLFSYMIKSLGYDVVDMIVIQGVIDRMTVTSVFYESVCFQGLELMRDGRLRHAELFSYSVDTVFSIRKHQHYLEPGRITEDLEESGQIFQFFSVEIIHLTGSSHQGL